MKILVIDGYNVINKLSDLSEIADGNLKDARDAVTKPEKCGKTQFFDITKY